jgi:hypothetical protein
VSLSKRRELRGGPSRQLAGDAGGEDVEYDCKSLGSCISLPGDRFGGDGERCGSGICGRCPGRRLGCVDAALRCARGRYPPHDAVAAHGARPLSRRAAGVPLPRVRLQRCVLPVLPADPVSQSLHVPVRGSSQSLCQRPQRRQSVSGRRNGQFSRKAFSASLGRLACRPKADRRPGSRPARFA